MRLRFAIVAVSLLAVVPGLSIALGLGPIQLKSGLNAPLNSEIELTATPEELATLKAQIASRETFSRYGLDYPSFLTGIEVKIVRAPDGRDVITLTSSAPMVEPFATILVDATWARGRNLREYTVLFDPPVFAPEGAREQPVAAPVTGGGDRSGVVARPEPAAPAAPAPVAAAPAVASSADGSYVVRNGDSLSAITRQQYGQTSNDRAMIAIYRENPAAFNGNINELRAGAVLRLPDSAAISAVDPGEAAAEVRRQSALIRDCDLFHPPLRAAVPAVRAVPRTRPCRTASPGLRPTWRNHAGCWSCAMQSWRASRAQPLPPSRRPQRLRLRCLHLPHQLRLLHRQPPVNPSRKPSPK
jgi:pilus assembly protein FimV